MEEDESPFPKTLFVNKAVIQTLRTSETEIEIDEEDNQSNHCHLQNSTEECEFVNSLPSFDAVETNIKETVEEQFLSDHLSISKSESKTKGDEDSLAYNYTEMIEVKEEINEEECNLVEESNLMKSESDIQVDTNIRASNELLPIKVENDGRVFNPMKSDGVESQETSSECREIKQESNEEDEDLPFVTFGHTTNDGSSRVTPQEVSTTEYTSRTQENLPQVCDGFYGASNTERRQTGEMPVTGSSDDEALPVSCDIKTGKRVHCKEEFYTCSVCDSPFSRKVDFEIHMRLHTGDKPFKCTVCNKSFYRKSHLCIVIPEREKNLTPKDTLENDMEGNDRDEKEYECGVCGRAFKSISDRTTHMNKKCLSFNEIKHTGGMLITGDSDDEALPVWFNERGQIEGMPVTGNSDDEALPVWFNERGHTGEIPVTDNVDDEALSDSCDIKTEMRMHSKEKLYTCSVCDSPFSCKVDFEIHMQLHTGDEPFKCTVCNKSCYRKSHLCNVIPEREKNLTTPIDKLENDMEGNNVGEKEFECRVCGKVSASNADLKRHMRVHTGERPYQCTVCDKAFSIKSNCAKHMKRHMRKKRFTFNEKRKTGEISITDNFDDEAFPVSLNEIKHKREMPGIDIESFNGVEKEFHCGVCGKVSASNADLIKHMRVHTGERPYQCTVCDKAFSTKSICTTHMKIHMKINSSIFNEIKHTGEMPGSDIDIERENGGESAYMCGVCGKASTTNADLKKHMRVHTGEKPFQCTICNKAFTDQSNCKTHMKRHARERRFRFNERRQTGEIPITGNIDDEALLLSRRKQTGVKPGNGIEKRQKTYVCGICGKASTRSTDIKKHMRVHTGERPYHCTVCDKAFKSISNCTTHMKIHMKKTRQIKTRMRMHSKEKLYMCSVCNRAFSRKDEFEIHVRMHTGDKPFKCTICDKTFYRKSVLVRHNKIHEREKNGEEMAYECGKESTSDADLKMHMRVHTGERHFKCTVCDKAFSTKSNCTKHMKKHTREIPITGYIGDEALPVGFDERGQAREMPVIDIKSFNQGEKEFEHEVCGKGSLSHANLKRHVRVHTGEPPFRCAVCDKAFSIKSNCTKHTKRHARKHCFTFNEKRQTGGIPITGNIDDEALPVIFNERGQTGEIPITGNSDDEALPVSFNEKRQTGEIPITGNSGNEALPVSFNEGGQTEERPVTSNIDDGAFPVSLNEIKHTEEMFGIDKERLNGDEKEGVCGNASASNGHLEKHVQVHAREKTFKCTICDKAYSTQSSCNQHMQAHTKGKLLICNICDKAFSTISNCTKHMKRIHIYERGQTGEIPITDDIDDGALLASVNEIKHTEEMFGIDKERLNGDEKEGVRGNVSASNGHLEKHMQVHTREKTLKCTICDKAFSTQSSCTQHMQAHTREKLLICIICDKAFSTIGNCTKHMRRIHTGKKRFRFNKIDLGMNTGEKPFKCSVCNEAFFYKDQLEIHIKLHIGEKHFKCSVCDKAFYREIVLKRHMNIHEEDKNLTLKGEPGSDMDSNIQKCDSVDALPAKSGQSGPITCLPHLPNAKFFQHFFQ